MSKKQPNRLAQLIDHQAFSGSALPRSLADNVRLYTQATHEVKTLLIDCLPEEILNSCWVVRLTTEQLTLSVNSMTAANHIRYLQNAYLEVLTKQSITFKQLKQIHVVIAKIPAKSPYNEESLTPVSSSSNAVRTNANKGLSQNIKRTISQAAKHVTADKDLQKALLQLLDD
ncbi:hypothetical protein [Psychrobacter sp. GP33]|uniref:hypothetical protein n=1 Tax=Psychrobacter sp. GP33 TaxID=2758709 RepID=UPI0015FE5F10|nr:hypothetical protein [Psychrobacter sp. GP33]